MKKLTTLISVTFCLILSSLANASELNDEIKQLQMQWAHINYQLKNEQQAEAFEALIVKAEQTTQRFRHDAEAWIWSGIVKSSFAGKQSGLDGLSLVKSAKKDLEKAIELDEKALKGSALMSLGILFHKVPGWPIAFGDNDEAEKFLVKSLSINPDGIDSNYFYGEYLYDEGEYRKAQRYLLAAQNAAPRLERPLADKYRQDEITHILAKVEKRLKK